MKKILNLEGRCGLVDRASATKRMDRGVRGSNPAAAAISISIKLN